MFLPIIASQNNSLYFFNEYSILLNIFVCFDNTIQHIDYRLLTKAIFEIKFRRLYIIFCIR